MPARPCRWRSSRRRPRGRRAPASRSRSTPGRWRRASRSGRRSRGPRRAAGRSSPRRSRWRGRRPRARTRPPTRRCPGRRGAPRRGRCEPGGQSRRARSWPSGRRRRRRGHPARRRRRTGTRRAVARRRHADRRGGRTAGRNPAWCRSRRCWTCRPDYADHRDGPASAGGRLNRSSRNSDWVWAHVDRGTSSPWRPGRTGPPPASPSA